MVKIIIILTYGIMDSQRSDKSIESIANSGTNRGDVVVRTF